MMRTLKAVFPTVGLALGMYAVVAAPFVTSVVYAAEEQKVSAKVGKPLQEALAAGQKKQWDVALGKLKESEMAEGKTTYDQFKIDELYGWVYSNQKKYADAAAAFEKTLNSGFLSEQEKDQRLKQVAISYLQSKQNTKAADYIQQWLKNHPNDADSTAMGAYLAQLQYQQGQNKQAIDTIQNVISASEKSGQAPKEDWLKVLLAAATKAQDNQGSQNATVLKALEKLVRYYPKPIYWESLLAGMSQQQNSDAFNYELYRLMLDTGTLKKPDDYVNYAQLASRLYGLPGEAQTALEAGFTAGVLGKDSNKDKHDRLLATNKQLASQDKATLADEEKKAAQAPTGQTDVALGLAYLSYSQYQQAVDAIERGLKKGGVKNPDQAQIALGIAYLRNNQRDKARTAFKAVQENSELGRIASLWVLKASSTAS